jgi:hypothetical protein
MNHWPYPRMLAQRGGGTPALIHHQMLTRIAGTRVGGLFG